jgi:DNA-binding MarR family transcriptional regulator
MPPTQPDEQTARAAALALELRVLFGQMKRRLRDQTDVGELNWGQVGVLGRLEAAGKATVTSLAREEGMRPQSMGAIVASLADAGFILGTPDPEDGRQTILSLSVHGLAWVQTARAARQDWLTRAIEARLTIPEQEELSNAMVLLKRLIEP